MTDQEANTDNSGVTYIVTFSCQHSRGFREPAPKRGEQLVCLKCSRTVTVIAAPAEYRIRCDNCGHCKPFGRAKINAEIAAAKHRMRHPGHVVRILDGAVTVGSFGDRDQTVIPMSPESDPRAPF